MLTVEALLESIADPLLALDAEWRVTHVNGAAQRLLAVPRATLLQRPVGDTLPEPLADELQHLCQRARDEQVPVELDVHRTPLQTWLHLRAVPQGQDTFVFLGDATDQHAPGHPLGKPAHAAALSARREQALAEVAARVAYGGSLHETLDALAQTLVESSEMSACAIVLIEDDPLHARVAGTYGLPASYADAFDRAVRAGVDVPALHAFRSREPMILPSSRGDPALEHQGEQDASDPALVCVPLLARGQVLGVLKAFYPASVLSLEEPLGFVETVADQAAVAVDSARLLDRALGTAALEERARISRDLHDALSQTLFGIGLLTRAAQLGHERAGGSPEDGLGQTLADLSELAKTALAETRSLVFELRPGLLLEEGLAVALRRRAEAVGKRVGMTVEVEVSDEPLALPPPVQEQVYRVAQEAIHNAAKHARASAVTVRLAEQERGWRLEIEDDGVGFDPAQAHSGRLGLTTMSERAARLGGQLDIRSAPGRGTCVTLVVPAHAPHPLTTAPLTGARLTGAES